MDNLHIRSTESARGAHSCAPASMGPKRHDSPKSTTTAPTDSSSALGPRSRDTLLRGNESKGDERMAWVYGMREYLVLHHAAVDKGWLGHRAHASSASIWCYTPCVRRVEPVASKSSEIRVPKLQPSRCRFVDCVHQLSEACQTCLKLLQT